MQPIDTTPIDTHIERLGPMAAANLRATAVDPFEAFVAPGDVFRHPREVLSYPGLSRAEKRAILASWASDARAVDSCPTLRCLPGCRAEPVPIDDVLAALQALDGTPAPSGQATGKARIPVVLGRRLRRGLAARDAVLN
ncbi:hypothetical protein QO001_003795 [Methylobacterium brachiatum]|uniref:Uncharacterized protein n=1 Tax=Methylobacterium brachiatum TaxID=269660 RepID=A0AAJ1WVP7_9HYPH|nr:hypothetical protein [Methylobacterium brachiatum]MCB4801608.1 hypothetical protein [Methylobacterium brachiatum]MDQ0544859.1 hypothetical protein [Methylobacterium brachiatum]